MLYKAKLDWEVAKIPSQTPKSHSNQETFRFYKAYFDAGNAEIETVGSLDGSRIIWALARLNQNFILPGNDELQGYIPHDLSFNEAMALRKSDPDKYIELSYKHSNPNQVKYMNFIDYKIKEEFKSNGYAAIY